MCGIIGQAQIIAVPEKKLEWFRVLNGMAVGDEVKVGDKVKVVEGCDAPLTRHAWP
jgi:predicted Zn-dependent protease